MDSPNSKPNHIFFSLQQNVDFLDHGNPCLISFQQENHTPDLHDHVPVVDRKGKSSTSYRSNSSKKSGGADGENDHIQKKMVHREIERQRRQEMAKLYASLRDLLPLEFIKGNRSISDHMNQAVHYIKQMEENVKELSAKRDQLKMFSNTNEKFTNNLPNTVSVSICNGGFQILVNSCLIEDGFMLSGVLKTLVKEGLNVTSCTLTKVKDRLFHSIQTEASDLESIDPYKLQQSLALVANTQTNFS